MFSNLACRVCGNMQEEAPWGGDNLCPTYDICDCCGVEFGYGDCNLKAVLAFRKKWLAKGAIWRDTQEEPPNWSLTEQMKNIPSEFR